MMTPDGVTATQPSIGNGIGQNTTLRTQTFHVKGYDARGTWKELRTEAADKDHAIGIAHEKGLRVAECVQIETKI